MPTRDAALSAALEGLNRGRVLESIEQLKEIVRSNPKDATAHFYLSTLFTEIGEYDFAERYLRRAMEADPKQGVYYHQLGLIRYRQKQWRSALELFKEALNIGAGSNEATVWRSIGDVQVELFDRAAALQAYETAVRIQPRDARSRLALGRFYLERSEPDSAIQQLRAALEIDPLLRAVYPVLGRAYRQKGDLASAASVLKKAVGDDPADQESRYALGQVLLASGSAEEGRRELDKYENVRQQVDAANERYKLGLSRLEAGKNSDAEQLFREALRLAPTYGPALLSLGTLLLDRGSPDKAMDFLKRAVDATPLNATAWFGLGNAYFKTGKLTEALVAARRAVVLDEDDSRYQRLVTDIQTRIRK